MLDTLIQAVNIVFKPEVLLVMLASSFYGIIIGAIPGLTAVMAVSLIMPIAIFLDPVPALAAIIACDAMAVFAGDIPGTLLRIPGTPASGAYTDDSYKLTQQGKAEMVLGANCFFSAIGGLFGLVVLVCAAPLLAEVALNFSTYEYFWLACLGLTCATFMTSQDKVKGIASLFLGLFITTIGYDSITGQPRFTFGSTELLAGIHVIPVLIGLFAVSEIMRRVSSTTPPAAAYNGRIGNIYTGIFKVWREHIPNFLRGNTIGVVVGALPGAGADIAAWLAYAISKKFSKTPAIWRASSKAPPRTTRPSPRPGYRPLSSASRVTSPPRWSSASSTSKTLSRGRRPSCIIQRSYTAYSSALRSPTYSC